MRADGILLRSFEQGLERVHLARIRLVFVAVYTLLRSGKLSLTSLGRAIAGSAPKHGIKRIDRLLGNTRLHSERIEFYRAIARRLIATGSRPVLIVDWTAVTPQLWALVAAVSYEGRALIVYAETHDIGSYGKPHVNRAFLEHLKSVLPRCAPIVLTDAGFRSPWMKLVQSHGWDYIGRIRGRARVRSNRGEDWSDIERLWRMAGPKPSDLGSVEMGSNHRFRHTARIVAIRKKLKYKRRPAMRDHGAERQRRAAREPWILATSLHACASKIVHLYARRMQIEETFRDAKSHRFGISLAHARTKSPSRADVLLLLASFAHVIFVLLGLAAEAARLQLRYQANTTSTRRVLSLAMLGRLVLAEHAETLLAPALSDRAWARIETAIAGAFRP
jgi:hypothetical protein